MKKIFAAVLVLLCASCAHGMTGSGTSDDPYMITSVSDFASISSSPSAYYVLENDIQLTTRGYWDPINFSGTLDGNGKIIYVHMIPEFDSVGYPVEYERALFGTLSGTVKNLYVGGDISSLRAAAVALTLAGGTIENCTVSVDVKAPAGVNPEMLEDSVSRNILAGGVVARMLYGDIKKCMFNGSTYTEGNEDFFSSTGGIAAYVEHSSHYGHRNITDCNVTPVSLITAEGDGAIAGGIVGYMNADFTDVVSGCTVEGIVQSSGYAGGVAGHVRGGTLTNNRIEGNSAVIGELSAGGIAGLLDSGAHADDNEVAAGVLVSSDVSAGGIAGFVELAYVAGNTAYASLGGSAQNKGGVIGEIHIHEGTSDNISGNTYYGAEYAIGTDENGAPSDGSDNTKGTAVFAVNSAIFSTGKVSWPYTAITLTTNAGDTSGITWQITDGALPEGLTLSTEGKISGTPEEDGDFEFTVEAAKGYITASKNFYMTVAPAFTITTDEILTSATFGTHYSFTLSADTDTPEYLSWTLDDGSALPEGLTLGTLTGEISGKPKEAGTFIFTVNVTERKVTISKEFTLLVYPAVLFSMSSILPSAVSGSEYSCVLSCDVPSGHSVTWKVASGDFPGGLELDAYTGTITGTPSEAGTYIFYVTAKTGTISAAKPFSLTVTPTINITTNSILANAQFGEYYSCDIDADTENVSWSLDDGSSIPEGLTLSADSGEIFGVPEESGTFTFTIIAASNDCTASKKFTLTVNDRIIFVTQSPLANAVIGLPYSLTLKAVEPSGRTISWAITSGTLPPGLEFNESTAEISGTPEEEGTFDFSVIARATIYRHYVDGTSYIYGYVRAINTYRITVRENLKITPSVLPSAPAGYEYSQKLEAGSPALWTVSSGDLPSGLSLGRGTGIISGIPDTAGDFTFTLRAASGDLSAEREFTLTVTLAITSGASLTGGVVDQSYSCTLEAAGLSSTLITWSADASLLPSGLYLASNGTISGTPTSAGTSTFTVYASGGGFSVSKEVSITVFASAEDVPEEENTRTSDTLIAIMTTALPRGITGREYYAELDSMTDGVTWSCASGDIPPGLTLNQSGVISGIPYIAGEYTFTVKASLGQREGTRRLVIEIVRSEDVSGDKNISGDVFASSGGGGCNSGFGVVSMLFAIALSWTRKLL